MRKILLQQKYPNRNVVVSDVWGTIENKQFYIGEEPTRTLGRVAKVYTYLEIDSRSLVERIYANKELQCTDKEIDRKFRLYLDNEKSNNEPMLKFKE